MAEDLIELGRKRCPKGEILRKGYRRKGYTRNGTRVEPTYVPPACVPDKGAPGKGPKTLPKPEKGSLKGWHADEAASKRRRALRKWVRKTNCRETIRKLTLLRNISTDRETDRAAKSDAEWLHKQDWCRLKTKND